MGMATNIPPHNLGEVRDAALGLAKAAKNNEFLMMMHSDLCRHPTFPRAD